MDPQLLERYGAPVPRYTSYPTAPHFHAGVTAADYRAWLGEIGEGDSLSLYLHIPFCAEMCWYCGCHTKVVRRYDPIADYLALLEREIDQVAAAIPGRPRIGQVHWGGGTPTMLSPNDFLRLTERLRRRFAFDAATEIDVEIDPRGLAMDKVSALAEAGVTRASLGVQDFNPAVQAAINRVQPYELTAGAVAALRAVGIAAINLDLMYGLPKQGIDDVLRTVDRAATLEPDRLAVFGYAHVPWMKRHQQMIAEADLPGPLERLEQAEATAGRLIAHGYRQIGLDHFARPDDPMTLALEAGELRRNFQGYTTDAADHLLGFGASAIGAPAQGYVQNAAPFHAYADAIGAGELAVARGLRLDAEDLLRRSIIERLMCDLAVDLDDMQAGNRPQNDFAAELDALAPLADDGLIRLDGRQIAVTERGRPFVRVVCARFDGYLGAGEARHSRAV